MRNAMILVLVVVTLGYTFGQITVSVNMEQYGLGDLDTAIWDVDSGSLVMAGSTASMCSLDVINLTNTDTITIDFGLQIEGVYDSLNNPVPWEPGFWFTSDIFVLRASFEKTPNVPDFWSYTRDYLRNSNLWATSGPIGRFGPSGSDLYVDSTTYLYLQFLAPLPTSVCGVLTIVTRLYVVPTGSFSPREKVSEGRMREFTWQPDESIDSGVYLIRVKGTNTAKRVVYLK